MCALPIYSPPILLAATPCLCFGSNTLDDDAMTSSALKTALLRSITSRRGSLSALMGITNGGGGLARSLLLFLCCVGRRSWVFSYLFVTGIAGFETVASLFLSCLVFLGSFSMALAAIVALILSRNQHRFPYRVSFSNMQFCKEHCLRDCYCRGRTYPSTGVVCRLPALWLRRL